MADLDPDAYMAERGYVRVRVPLEWGYVRVPLEWVKAALGASVGTDNLDLLLDALPTDLRARLEGQDHD